jgi:hypothetical protein
MASIIDASTAGVGGIITTADNSGNLNIQSGGSTKIAVTSAGVAVTGLAKASLPTGSVLQVVNATYSTYTTTSSSTFSDTGLTATITPTSATSKILVMLNVNGMAKETGNTACALRLLRNSTVVPTLAFEGTAAFTGTTTNNSVASSSLSYQDSPATTSAVIYKVQFASPANTALALINNGYNASFPSCSTITLLEIAA